MRIARRLAFLFWPTQPRSTCPASELYVDPVQPLGHENRCKVICPTCHASFESEWAFGSHIHGHRTGVEHRFRMGCDGTVRDADAGDQTGFDPRSLWFLDEAMVRKHRLVRHGASLRDAAETYGGSVRCEGPIVVPLVQESERQLNLDRWRLDERQRQQAYQAGLDAEKADTRRRRARETYAVRAEVTRLTETEAEREARLATANKATRAWRERERLKPADQRHVPSPGEVSLRRKNDLNRYR